MATYKGVKGKAIVVKSFTTKRAKEVKVNQKSLCLMSIDFTDEETNHASKTIADALNVRQQIKVPLTRLVPILKECLQYFENQSYEVKNEHLENELKKILRREKK